MPEWLQDTLGHLTEVEAVLTFFGSVLLACVPIYFRVRAEVKRNQKAMLAVPPTASPVGSASAETGPKHSSLPPLPAYLQTTPRASAEEASGRSSRIRIAWSPETVISSLEHELRTVGEDHAKTAQALLELERELAIARHTILELELERDRKKT